MWIIPARAGFTSISWCARGRSADHPRSRGVYRLLLGRQIRNHGSSPLARGLLSLCLTPRGRGADHPRSRGVYASQYRVAYARAGSSPLARGLPMTATAALDVYRIIPARAGFTELVAERPRRVRDHPRSRGVYTGPGTDPHSRGVYDGGVELRLVVGGIIPARAGFTISPFPGRRRGEDHPRSRGVYPVTWWGPCSTWGSSPLARGLLRSIRGQYRGAGIIPARAGFTATGTTAPYSDTDHPRSRGVYRPAGAARRGTWGSSPLARGLRRVSFRRVARFGIIPARAGFTDDLRH